MRIMFLKSYCLRVLALGIPEFYSLIGGEAPTDSLSQVERYDFHRDAPVDTHKILLEISFGAFQM